MEKINTNFKVSLCQISCKLGDIKYNKNKIIQGIKKSKESSSNIVIFPELSLSGYYLKDKFYEVSETIPGKSFNEIKKEAIKNQIHVIFGMPEKKSNFSEIIYNSLVWIKPNGDYKVYRKIYLPTYRIFEEQKYFRNGIKPCYVDTEFGRFGLTICFDVYFPELIRYLAMKECHTIINISSSPNPSKKYFETLINARCLENTINFIYVNVSGNQEGISFWGGSCVVNSKGETLAKCKYYEEDFLSVEIDLNEFFASKKNRPILKHVNHEIFKLCFETSKEI